MMNDFLEIIEADYHQSLLASGNLNKPRIPEWAGENRWTSQGYLARVLVSTCTSCGTISPSLQGIFHKETNPLGNVRLTALDLRRGNFPPDIPRETEETSVPICAHCI